MISGKDILNKYYAQYPYGIPSSQITSYIENGKEIEIISQEDMIDQALKTERDNAVREFASYISSCSTIHTIVEHLDIFLNMKSHNIEGI